MTVSVTRSLSTFSILTTLVLGASPARAAIILVDTNADSGAGSLRAAITAANVDSGFDEIRFTLDAGERNITPLTPLPIVSQPAYINGTSQAGWTNAPLIGLNGATAHGTGLRFTNTFSGVAGLAIYGFATGVSIEGNLGSVKSNYIGLTTAGAGGSGNTGVGLNVTGDFATVGGTTVVDRNVISGNGSNGITIGAAANGGLFYNNYIGTNVAGTSAIGNGSYGIRSFGSDNQIGTNLVNGGNLISGNDRGVSLEAADDVGTTLRNNIIGLNAAGTAKIGNNGNGVECQSNNNRIGGSFAMDRNLISGNKNSGVSISAGKTDNLIQSNYIGTDTTGAVAIGNGSGVTINGNENTVGGTAALEGNLIAGNTFGMDVAGTGNVVKGNYIGTNAAGDAKIANTDSGVRLYGEVNTLGGTTAGSGNLISGNGTGVLVISSQGNLIQGNRIGTNKAGNTGLGNKGYGIRVIDSHDTVITSNVVSGNERGIALDADAPSNMMQANIVGLTADGMGALGATAGSGLEVNSASNLIGGPDAGNIFSSNQYYGIVLEGPNATDNLIQGNRIGVALDGTTLRGNYFNVLFYGASGNDIGGVNPDEGNTIAGSTNAGVYVWFGTHNRILRNSIFENGGQGIEIDPQGLEPNDELDPDTGSNEKQNLPVITSAVVNAAQLVIQGKLASQPSKFYRIEFFTSPDCDASGFGEGQHFLGSAQVQSDADGIATIATSLPYNLGDDYLTATATSPDGDTSEFSPCADIDAGANAGQLQFAQDNYLAYEELGFVTITVSRSNGATGAVSVHYETVEDTATAPEDYTHVSGTLSFADGEVLKSFKIRGIL